MNRFKTKTDSMIFFSFCLPVCLYVCLFTARLIFDVFSLRTLIQLASCACFFKVLKEVVVSHASLNCR